jgi:hypothetical protein
MCTAEKEKQNEQFDNEADDVSNNFRVKREMETSTGIWQRN